VPGVAATPLARLPYAGGMTPGRRKPWVAAILSLPLAGLGHLYAGARGRAAAFFLGEVVTSASGLLILIEWRAAPWNLAVSAGFPLAWRTVAAVSAFRFAARHPPCAGRPAWLRWPAYLVAFLAGAYGPVLALRATAIEAFRVPTRSMSDTLIPGDRLLATKWGLDSLRRGDVIVFRVEENVSYAKRVIGLPGDLVEVREGLAVVNGERLDEPYARRDGPDRGDFGPVEVPARSYFVLGDNRHAALDSRSEKFGFIPAGRVVGRARTIVISQDPETGDVRWNRLGLPLD